MEKDNVFFVGIRNHNEIRRDILESSRQVIDLLKRHELFKAIRQEKNENIKTLKRIIKELHDMIGQYEKTLPKTHIKAKNVQKEEHKIVQQVKKTPKKPVKKQLTEVERLENELTVIESRLKKLSY